MFFACIVERVGLFPGKNSPDHSFHHVLERAAGQCKRLSDLLHRLARLSVNSSRYDIAAFVPGYLATHEYKAAGLRRQ